MSTHQLEMGHARALLALDSELQQKVAQHVAAKKMTVRQAEQLVKKTLEPPKQESVKKDPTQHVVDLSKVLEQQINARVNVDISSKGKARITINLDDGDELVNIQEHYDKTKK